jgi:hypothetical protein
MYERFARSAGPARPALPGTHECAADTALRAHVAELWAVIRELGAPVPSPLPTPVLRDEGEIRRLFHGYRSGYNRILALILAVLNNTSALHDVRRVHGARRARL